MSEAMAETNEDRDTVRTSVEVEEIVWRQLRAKAVEEGNHVSEQLEAVLREYFGLEEADTQ